MDGLYICLSTSDVLPSAKSLPYRIQSAISVCMSLCNSWRGENIIYLVVK